MLRTSEFILNFILNSCWQIAVIFAITALAAWLLRNGPARYRHALWIVALTAGVVVPAWASNVSVSAPSRPIPVNAEDPVVDHIGSPRRKTVTTSTSSVLILSFAYMLFICGRAIRLARFWARKR